MLFAEAATSPTAAPGSAARPVAASFTGASSNTPASPLKPVPIKLDSKRGATVDAEAEAYVDALLGGSDSTESLRQQLKACPIPPVTDSEADYTLEAALAAADGDPLDGADVSGDAALAAALAESADGAEPAADGAEPTADLAANMAESFRALTEQVTALRATCDESFADMRNILEIQDAENKQLCAMVRKVHAQNMTMHTILTKFVQFMTPATESKTQPTPPPNPMLAAGKNPPPPQPKR